jgi:hypothetical protein
MRSDMQHEESLLLINTSCVDCIPHFLRILPCQPTTHSTETEGCPQSCLTPFSRTEDRDVCPLTANLILTKGKSIPVTSRGGP